MPQKTFLTLLLCMFTVLTGTAGAASEPAVPLTTSIARGPVKVTITADPGLVEYSRDILLTIRVEAQNNVSVILPDIADRLEGFILSGEYGGEPVQQNGSVVIEKHALITPVLADEHRLAPLAIIYSDKNRTPETQNWFATRPVVFKVKTPADAGDSADIKENLQPVWIYPPPRTIALWIMLAVIAAALCALLWKLLKKIHREVQLRKLSPRERAMKELEFLLARHLPEKDMLKEFYLELTMIVRSYIERAHAIRAPEQTTEEFLAEVSHNPEFNTDVLVTLKNFLEAADLVKFAAYRPGMNAVQNATETAKTYIDSDDKAGKSHV